MTVEVDRGVVAEVAVAMRTAAGDLDQTCRHIPTDPGAGDATPLLTDILYVVASTVARLSVEADVVGERLDESAAAYAGADDAASERASELFDADLSVGAAPAATGPEGGPR